MIAPQATSVATFIDNVIASTLATTRFDETITYDALMPKAAAIRARAILRARKISADRQISILAGSTVYADALLAGEIDDQGRIAEMPIYENTVIPADAMYVFVREAVAVVVRAPQVPDTAEQGASVVEGGMAISGFAGFDPRNGATLSTLTALIGVKALDLQTADFEEGETVAVPFGAIVSINTTGA